LSISGPEQLLEMLLSCTLKNVAPYLCGMSWISQPIDNPFASDIIALLGVIYMKRISIFLIMVALITGMVGCASSPVQYDLTISSTVGGSVTTPGEAGPYTYDEGIVIHLVAEAEDGYQFIEWTGDVDSIANVEAATSNITMSGSYSITAEFVKQYNLTIASTAGGSVTTPGEAGPYTYDEGTVVNLVAEAEEGCKFGLDGYHQYRHKLLSHGGAEVRRYRCRGGRKLG